MSDFDLAVTYVINNEIEDGKSLIDDPNDPGKITNYGISLTWYKDAIFSDATPDDIKALTLDKAKELYKKYFWDNQPYHFIICQELTNYIFDMSVNMSPAEAHKTIQRATWALSHNYMGIADDGILGANTLDAINYYSRNLMPPLRSERAAYYRILVEKEPYRKKYINGWLKRAYK